MKVVFTAVAEAELEAIGDYIAQHNPRRAISFVSDLIDRCASLAETPRGFPLVPRHERTGIRRRSHGNYLIFYRVGDDLVEVLHVLNGVRNYEAILFPDD